jgi:outer membrane murein-binding lipoprotein Lpp
MSYEQLEAVVMSILREQLTVLQEFGNHIEEKRKKRSQDTDFRKMEKNIEAMKAERIRQYEAYAEGLITKEQYISRKENLTEKIEKLKTAMERVRTLMESDQAMGDEMARFNQKADKIAGESRLTKGIADAFIEMVYIYDPKTIEVHFKFDDLLHKATEKYNMGDE